MQYMPIIAKKYTHLLFDLDGTITYSHLGIYNSVNYAMQQMGRGELGQEMLRKFVGPPLRISFQEIAGFCEQDALRAVAFYRERYSKIGWREVELIPGAKELLFDLQKAGYHLALATSKPAVFADKIVEELGLLSCFEQTGVATFQNDTKPFVIAELIFRLGVDKNQCLMIGDRSHDVLGAREVGVDCAGLYVGYAEQNELETAGATYVFKDFSSLREFLL